MVLPLPDCWGLPSLRWVTALPLTLKRQKKSPRPSVPAGSPSLLTSIRSKVTRTFGMSVSCPVSCLRALRTQDDRRTALPQRFRGGSASVAQQLVELGVQVCPARHAVAVPPGDAAVVDLLAPARGDAAQDEGVPDHRDR